MTGLVNCVLCSAWPECSNVARNKSRRTWLESGNNTLGLGVALGERVRTISWWVTKVWPHSGLVQLCMLLLTSLESWVLVRVSAGKSQWGHKVRLLSLMPLRARAPAKSVFDDFFSAFGLTLFIGIGSAVIAGFPMKLGWMVAALCEDMANLLLAYQTVLGFVVGQGLHIEVAHKARGAVACVLCGGLRALQRFVGQAQGNGLVGVQRIGW